MRPSSAERGFIVDTAAVIAVSLATQFRLVDFKRVELVAVLVLVLAIVACRVLTARPGPFLVDRFGGTERGFIIRVVTVLVFFL